MLQNRVPGLEVLPLGDGTYTLRLRGGHSLSGSPAEDEPLLVIDDVPVQRGWLGTALAGVAPRDVARVDVLKDAAASSRYGFQGSNGVIVITTKRGR
jgi:TonB-dependent SusC/RagA subfamily outer membrane receptor